MGTSLSNASADDWSAAASALGGRHRRDRLGLVELELAAGSAPNR